MKTREQKGQELQKGREFLEKSVALVFTDFSKTKTGDIAKLRQQLKNSGSGYLVIKKRLLNILLKEKGIDLDARKFESQVGTIFSSENLEQASKPVFDFFNALGGETKAGREESVKKILGGYDIEARKLVEAGQILMIGKLPPREVLLAQLLGMIASPVRSFLYVLDQKSKQTVETK